MFVCQDKKRSIVLLVFVLFCLSIWHKKEGIWMGDFPPLHWFVEKSVRHYLIPSWCGRIWVTVNGTISGHMVLCIIRKQVEPAIESRSLTCTPIWLLLPSSYLEFLPCLLSLIDCDLKIARWNQPFLLWVAFGHGLCQKGHYICH